MRGGIFSVKRFGEGGGPGGEPARWGQTGGGGPLGREKPPKKRPPDPGRPGRETHRGQTSSFADGRGPFFVFSGNRGISGGLGGGAGPREGEIRKWLFSPQEKGGGTPGFSSLCPRAGCAGPGPFLQVVGWGEKKRFRRKKQGGAGRGGGGIGGGARVFSFQAVVFFSGGEGGGPP